MCLQPSPGFQHNGFEKTLTNGGARYLKLQTDQGLIPLIFDAFCVHVCPHLYIIVFLFVSLLMTRMLGYSPRPKTFFLRKTRPSSFMWNINGMIFPTFLHGSKGLSHSAFWLLRKYIESMPKNRNSGALLGMQLGVYRVLGEWWHFHQVVKCSTSLVSHMDLLGSHLLSTPSQFVLALWQWLHLVSNFKTFQPEQSYKMNF